jgi:SAM-dependent methyltransferase
MNRETFDAQFAEFVKQSPADGRFSPRVQDQKFEPNEDTGDTEINYPYLLHCAWAARVLARTRPERHVDIGSYVYFVALASAIVPITFCDIRPAEMNLPGLEVRSADLMSLPFEDNSIKSLSCMHTIEHVGLGRYGDPVIASGDRLAGRELSRVLAPGGQLLIVVPMNEVSRVQFNSCRLYSYQQVLDLFPALKVAEFTMVRGTGLGPGSPEKVMKKTWPHNDTGCFIFTKENHAS